MVLKFLWFGCLYYNGWQITVGQGNNSYVPIIRELSPINHCRFYVAAKMTKRTTKNMFCKLYMCCHCPQATSLGWSVGITKDKGCANCKDHKGRSNRQPGQTWRIKVTEVKKGTKGKMRTKAKTTVAVIAEVTKVGGSGQSYKGHHRDYRNSDEERTDN